MEGGRLCFGVNFRPRAGDRIHTCFHWQGGFKLPGESRLRSNFPLIPYDAEEERASSHFYEVFQPGTWQGGVHTEAHPTCAIPPTESHISERHWRTSRKPKPPAVDSWQAKASSPGIGSLLTSRTLSHPSFISYYTAVAILQGSHRAQAASAETAHESILEDGRCGAVLPVNNSDFFYTDPLMTPGHRIYNCLSPQSQQVFQGFRLNTPPPIMSFCEQSAPRTPQAYTDFHSSEFPKTSDSITVGGKLWTKWLSIAEHDALSVLLDMTSCAHSEPVFEPTVPRPKVQELPLPSQDVLQDAWGMVTPSNIEANPVALQTRSSFKDHQLARFPSQPYDQPSPEGINPREVQHVGQELWQRFLNQEAYEGAGSPDHPNFGTLKEHQGTASCVAPTNLSDHIDKEVLNTQAQELMEVTERKKTQEGLEVPVVSQAHSGHYSPSEHIAISALLDLQLLESHKLPDEPLLSITSYR
uniref:Uncharacterized protein LOC117350774 isoform X2 n=1 Tax=Geotrypetes seraphini TaxID=260995 RepID=A0A6P8Q2C9_GEOSA|nr:uncharacterized protein LOC117350774 isoform X2 [Geotrypetes seraphini]